jgi:hypothetical protein
MGGRMNWDRARKDNLSRDHGSQRVNPLAEAGSHSRSTKKKQLGSNTPHPKTCRCEACKAYLLLIKRLNPERYVKLTGKLEPLIPTKIETGKQSARDRVRRESSRGSLPQSMRNRTLRNEVISPDTPIVGCTCGKTIAFTGTHKRRCALHPFRPSVAEKPLFYTQRQQEVAQATLNVLKFERLASLTDLKKPDKIQRILERVHTATAPAQGELASVPVKVDDQNIVSKTIDLFIEKSIAIPKVVLVPKDEGTAGYRDFGLDLKGIQLQPVAKRILNAQFHDQKGYLPEARLEDYIVRGLVDFDDVSYDDHRELLYKLADAVVRHLRSYLGNEDDVRNVLQFHQVQLANIIHAQMQQHREARVAEFEVNVTKGFTALRPSSYYIPFGEHPRDFRLSANENFPSRGVLFSPFKRCLSPSQRFQSDTERRFAVLLEDQSDPSILKWLKPGHGVFQIYYEKNTPYEPNFVVETKTAKLICEIKRVQDISTREVHDRANAAAKWCEYATVHEMQNGGKPWSYLLIPEDAVKDRLAWAVWRTRLKIESPKKFDELFG